MRNLSLRRLAVALFVTVLIGSGALVEAQNTGNDKPLRVKIEITFLSADKDVTDLTGSWAYTQGAYDTLIGRYTTGKKPRLHVWSVQSKVLNAGESFNLSSPTEGGGVEEINVATSKFGDSGREVALSISAQKQRLEERGARPYDVFDVWGLKTDITLPVGAVTVLGGQDGDPLLGVKSKNRLPPQALYVAISVRPAE